MRSKRLRHHRPVADPRAIVAARAGLEHRPVAAGEHLGKGRGDGVGERLLGRRDADRHAAQHVAPMRQRLGLGARERRRHRGAVIHRHDDAPRLAGPSIERIDQVGGGHVGAERGRQRHRGDRRAPSEAQGAHDRRIAFFLRLDDAQQPGRALDADDRARPALLRQELRGRVDLPRTNAEPQLDRAPRRARDWSRIFGKGPAPGVIGEQASSSGVIPASSTSRSAPAAGRSARSWRAGTLAQSNACPPTISIGTIE